MSITYILELLISMLIYSWQRLICRCNNNYCYNRFTALFPGPPGWADARRELLDFVVQGKINRGRHTDHLAGCHSIQTNQCPPPPSPILFVSVTKSTKICRVIVNSISKTTRTSTTIIGLADCLVFKCIECYVGYHFHTLFMHQMSKYMYIGPD